MADPATTQGLFEAACPQCSRGECQEQPSYDALTLETLRVHRPDLLEEAEKGLQEQLTEASSRADQAKRELLIHQLAQQHGLFKQGSRCLQESLGKGFYGLLQEADEASLSTLLAERAALLKGPRSVDPMDLLSREEGRITSARDFVKAVKQASY